MCHQPDARPPAAPDVTGAVARHGRMQITAADGNRMRAYQAVPAAPNGMSMVVLPDVRGLHPFYEQLAQRLAEAGFDTVAIDFYGRTAGTSERADSFDGMDRLPLLAADHVDADVAAAVGMLRGQRRGPVFTLGFCLGGGHSWRQAARPLGLAGAIGFYGPPRFFGDVTAELSAPLLMLLAGDDAATPAEDFQTLAAGFDEAGKDYEMHVYDGAPHSFFDRGAGDWAPAATDCWRRILAFTARNAARGVG